jgi:hypothetical protein
LLKSAVPGLTDELIAGASKSPLRQFDPELIQEPLVYRFYEVRLFAAWLGTICTFPCLPCVDSTKTRALIFVTAEHCCPPAVQQVALAPAAETAWAVLLWLQAIMHYGNSLKVRRQINQATATATEWLLHNRHFELQSNCPSTG